MNGSIWHKVAGLSGAAVVGLGAYGAHAFKPKDPYFLEVTHTPSPPLSAPTLLNRPSKHAQHLSIFSLRSHVYPL